MDYTFIELFGLAAGAITSISFIPQLYRGYKTKKLEDVSYYMFGILAFGMLMWFVYGLLRDASAVMIANAFGIICSLAIIIMKKRYS